MKFKTEKDARDWVAVNIFIAVKPKNNNAIKPIVYTFSSNHAMDKVIDHLGKKLFELQNKTKL